MARKHASVLTLMVLATAIGVAGGDGSAAAAAGCAPRTVVLPGHGFVNALSDSYAAGAVDPDSPARWSAPFGRRQPLVLEVPAGADRAQTLAVNNAGQVVGFAAYPAGPLTQPVRWDGSTATVLLSTAGAAEGWAWAVNDSGAAVGQMRVPASNYTHPYLWAPDGTPHDLGLPPGAISGVATAINDAGQVVGQLELSKEFHPRSRMFEWVAGAWTLFKGPGSPVGINNAGVILTGRGQVYDPGSLRPRNINPPAANLLSATTTSLATGGQVGGWTNSADGTGLEAVYWDTPEPFEGHILPRPRQAQQSWVNGVAGLNAAGGSAVQNGPDLPTVWLCAPLLGQSTTSAGVR